LPFTGKPMNKSPFHIYIDRLRDGKMERIDDDLPSSFLDIDEDELKFSETVHVDGEAYLADDHFVLRLRAQAQAFIPCLACNKMTEASLNVEDFYFSVPLKELTSPIFDYSEALREALLLELPQYVECNGGNCPERENIKVYLNKKPVSGDTLSTHFPFSDLEKE
jgi:uncharacterized metal-binding protein YceD (DUF177 family)